MYDGSTALILAARLAVEGMVEELITCHADVNAVDELGESAGGNLTKSRPECRRFALVDVGPLLNLSCCRLFQASPPCTGPPP